ncbi:uncharacterized protein LOC128712316 [Anopheles marshallii]|uniref:uncharacterized protein LOC128712316 n=1 Tax=Anopheles marshallii TaxID=1521116 RepID=UPI00237C0906|nr:uncharacterized protein LOC128712316 [Anopheles marshallii]
MASSGDPGGSEPPGRVGIGTVPADGAGKVDTGASIHPGSSSSLPTKSSLFGRQQQETRNSSFTVPAAAATTNTAAAKSSNQNISNNTNHNTNRATPGSMTKETPNHRVIPPGGREKTFGSGRSGEAVQSSPPPGDGSGDGRTSATGPPPASSASTKEQPQSWPSSSMFGDGS